MNRRRFVRTALFAAGALATAFVSGCGSGSDSSGSSVEAASDSSAAASGTSVASTGLRAGVQLYTLRSLLDDDFEGTLEQVAEIGYTEVELAGYYDRSMDAIGTLLDRLGLTTPSAHVQLVNVREHPDVLVERALALGNDYVVVPWLDPEDRQTLDDYRRLTDTLNDFGQRCADAGLQLAYHNHDFEFETLEGERPYDVLLAETDADLVAMELDLYWTVHAGHDPVALFERHPGRFPLWHLKDRTSDGAMAPVGAGTLDFATLLDHADAAGLRHAFVEHDNPDDALASLRTSFDGLQTLGIGG